MNRAILKMIVLKRKDLKQKNYELGKSKNHNSGKATSEKDNSEQEHSNKLKDGQTWKRTILKSKNLEKDKYKQEAS